jgi:hypothetical protein
VFGCFRRILKPDHSPPVSEVGTCHGDWDRSVAGLSGCRTGLRGWSDIPWHVPTSETGGEWLTMYTVNHGIAFFFSPPQHPFVVGSRTLE